MRVAHAQVDEGHTVKNLHGPLHDIAFATSDESPGSGRFAYDTSLSLPCGLYAVLDMASIAQHPITIGAWACALQHTQRDCSSSTNASFLQQVIGYVPSTSCAILEPPRLFSVHSLRLLPHSLQIGLVE